MISLYNSLLFFRKFISVSCVIKIVLLFCMCTILIFMLRYRRDKLISGNSNGGLILHDDHTGFRVYSQVFRNGNKCTISFMNAPINLHPLGYMPKSREPELQSGNWIVLTYSSYSASDVESISEAAKVAYHLIGKAHVGVRPSIDFSEIPIWCPECKAFTGASPGWIFIQDGVVQNDLWGYYTGDQISAISDNIFNTKTR